jgi:hypothetical protein
LIKIKNKKHFFPKFQDFFAADLMTEMMAWTAKGHIINSIVVGPESSEKGMLDGFGG